jgi:tetratricopeptide (TPR) repeat protein
MWQNCIATRETIRDNRPERALERWREVDASLSKITSTELSYVALLRGAIAYGVGIIEARLGFTSAEQTARALEDDPFQRVSGASLRRVARLHQGDFEGAERFRRRAELLALQSNQRTMFQSTLTAELIAYALASDLTGIRQLADAIDPLAARFPGWLGYKHLADGYFEQARGQFDAARAAFERGLRVAEPDPRDPNRCFGSWPRLEGAYVEVLVSLDRAADAKARGERALEICAEHGIDAVAFVIRRALALAEAKLGDYAGACRRLEDVIRDLEALGITGLELGATCEARARIAIWANDDAAIETYGRMTAKEYRHGERSPLGARYERLMDEARSSGVFVLPELTEFQTKLTTTNWRSLAGVATSVAPRPLLGTRNASERAERVLRLLCEARDARSGHLYLYRDSGLELAAWRGQDPPGPELRELAERFVAQQMRADDYATVIESEQRPPLTSSAWLDTRGVTHQFVLLSGKRGAERLCAGVAVIESSGNTGTDPLARQLLDELAGELLTRGDASGIADG